MKRFSTGSLLAVVLLLNGCNCGELDPKLLFRCESQSDCEESEVCTAGVCLPRDAGEDDAGPGDGGAAEKDGGAPDGGDGGNPDGGCVANVACASNPNRCLRGVTRCEPPACLDSTERLDAGTSCGNGLFCNDQGVCIGCSAGASCTTNPNNACRPGQIDCSSGSERCVDVGARPDGTNCGSDRVCRAGQCIACVAGAICSTNPSAPCKVGVAVCGAVTACNDGMNVAAGTSCGNKAVCNGNGACVACDGNKTCSLPGQPCKTGRIECTTGAEVCVVAGNAAPGVSCGSNQVCNGAGSCNPCAAGVACNTNPTAPCRVGVTSCTTGSAVCVDQGNRDAGTPCAGGQVCDGNGFCGVCVANQPCTGNGDPCKQGVTSCNGAVTSCVNGAAKPVGTTCGAGAVCNAAGACVSCSTGVCFTNPGGQCVNGSNSCASGAPVCTDGTVRSAGSACDGGVCNPSGACVACVPNQACTTNPNPACRTGSVACNTGTPSCNDTGFRAAGATCDGGVCDGNGGCIACAAGSPCNTNPNPGCFDGVISCGTGAAVCVDGMQKSAGTACGAGKVCSPSGTCINCDTSLGCTSNPNPQCFNGQTVCSSGMPACANGAPKAAGTVCTGGVCNGSGTCVSCTEGAGCSGNPSVCRNGATACATGAPVCADGSPKPAGTACNGSQLCDGVGGCGTCTAGGSCTTNPNSACFSGVVSCATGNAACVDGAAKPAGTSCGSNQVCSPSQQCVACTAGQACTTNPNSACREGTTQCSSGAPVCVDAAAKAPGTACSGGVCNGSGSCVPCAPGASCSGNPSVCKVGTTNCSSGAPVCVDSSSNVGAGVACPGGVCNGSGTCNSCVADAGCSPGPCHNGATQCSSGSPMCAITTQRPAGSSCSADGGAVCAADAGCVACNSGALCTTNPNWPCSEGQISCSSGAPVCVDSTPQGVGTPCQNGGVCDNSGVCGSVSCPTGCIGQFGGCQSGDSAFDCGQGGGACADCTVGGGNCICDSQTRVCRELMQRFSAAPGCGSVK